MISSRPLAAVAALATLLGAASLAPDPAAARPRAGAVQASSGIEVDVSRLRALGLGPVAEVIGAAVADALRAEAGERGYGGRLVVRLTALSLNAYAGSNSGGGGGFGGGSGGSGADYDYLEGEILVVGPRGEILSQRPQLSAVPASSGGAYYLPGAEKRRVIAVAQHFAAWARRSTL